MMFIVTTFSSYRSSVRRPIATCSHKAPQAPQNLTIIPTLHASKNSFWVFMPLAIINSFQVNENYLMSPTQQMLILIVLVLILLLLALYFSSPSSQES